MMGQETAGPLHIHAIIVTDNGLTQERNECRCFWSDSGIGSRVNDCIYTDHRITQAVAVTRSACAHSTSDHRLASFPADSLRERCSLLTPRGQGHRCRL